MLSARRSGKIMNNSDIPSFPNISLSHFELYVDDVSCMEEFYTRCLGLVVTDRGNSKHGMVFLSANPDEHHQLVLTPRKSATEIESPIDHIAFRVDCLVKLRVFHKALKSNSITMQTVSHGTTWSIYFLDPEKNRLELFTDTPWHVNQPCRFEVDFEMPNDELLEFTEQKIKDLPGFVEVNKWRESHSTNVNGKNIQ
jgi:catechol 2,3-dioxygenase